MKSRRRIQSRFENLEYPFKGIEGLKDRFRRASAAEKGQIRAKVAAAPPVVATEKTQPVVVRVVAFSSGKLWLSRRALVIQLGADDVETRCTTDRHQLPSRYLVVATQGSTDCDGNSADRACETHGSSNYHDSRACGAERGGASP